MHNESTQLDDAIAAPFTDLSTAQVETLKSTIARIINLRDEIENLERPTRNPFHPTLSDYAERLLDTVFLIDHGDRDIFFVPEQYLRSRLSEFKEINTAKLKTAFLTHRKKLFTIADRYIKEMQKGFKRIEMQTKSNKEL